MTNPRKYWLYTIDTYMADSGNYAMCCVTFRRGTKLPEDNPWYGLLVQRGEVLFDVNYRSALEIVWQANKETPTEWYGPRVQHGEISKDAAQCLAKLADNYWELTPQKAIEKLKAIPAAYESCGVFKKTSA